MVSFLKFLGSYRFSRYFKTIQLLSDLAFLNLSFIVSFYLRYGSFSQHLNKDAKTIWLLANLFWLIILNFNDAYKLVRIERIESVLSRVIRSMFIHMGLIALCVVLLKFDEISRLRMLYFFSMFYSLVVLFRIVFVKFLKTLRLKGFNYRNVIIIGINENGIKIEEVLKSDYSFGFRVLGFFDSKEANEYKKMPIGKLDEVEDFIKKNIVHEMHVALHFQDSESVAEMISLCEKYMVRIKFVPDFYKYTGARKVNIDFYENIPVLMLRKEPLELPFNRLLKKMFDLAFSLFLFVVVFSWLFPILAVLVKLSSKGPVFFSQYRSGEDKKSFVCYKFRTMKVNDLSDELQASKDDPRLTKLGAFMRKTNLDELPQFFNVLKGEMSVVGPRPHMLKHTEQYSSLIDNYLVRHFAKPGITGWAQVNGYRGETREINDMKMRVEYDIWYIENWSFLLDIKIIFRTIFNMISGDKKAY
jgi:putative colanic acid biosysnthesis UDP-glucose lipid carrier transferase